MRAKAAMFVGKDALFIRARASTAPNPKSKMSEVLIADTKLIHLTVQMSSPRTVPMAIMNLEGGQSA